MITGRTNTICECEVNCASKKLQMKWMNGNKQGNEIEGNVHQHPYTYNPKQLYTN